MHFLQQIVFQKAWNHYFSAGNRVFKNDHFLCPFLLGNTNVLLLLFLPLHPTKKKKKKQKPCFSSVFCLFFLAVSLALIHFVSVFPFFPVLFFLSFISCPFFLSLFFFLSFLLPFLSILLFSFSVFCVFCFLVFVHCSYIFCLCFFVLGFSFWDYLSFLYFLSSLSFFLSFFLSFLFSWSSCLSCLFVSNMLT